LGKVDFDTMMMQGPGIYLEKPVKPAKYIETVCKILKIDPREYVDSSKKTDPSKLREELSKSLNGADVESLQKALDALKNK